MIRTSPYLILFLLLIASTTLRAQVDTIKVQNNDLIIDQLKAGTTEYLVYVEHPNGTILDLSVWERSVEFGIHNGIKTIQISQQWKNQDPLFETTATRCVVPNFRFMLYILSSS